jgi:hypothetical protein
LKLIADQLLVGYAKSPLQIELPQLSSIENLSKIYHLNPSNSIIERIKKNFSKLYLQKNRKDLDTVIFALLSYSYKMYKQSSLV